MVKAWVERRGHRERPCAAAADRGAAKWSAAVVYGDNVAGIAAAADDGRSGVVGDAVALGAAVGGGGEGRWCRCWRRAGDDGDVKRSRGAGDIPGGVLFLGCDGMEPVGQRTVYRDRPAAAADSGGAEQIAAAVEQLDEVAGGAAAAGDRRLGDVGDVVAGQAAVAGRCHGETGGRRRRGGIDDLDNG